jgi:hypothetical protein
VLVHPDIKFPSTPSQLVPLNPEAIKKTKDSQYSLFRELSTTLGRTGQILAIDTTDNLDFWSRLATSFSNPVVLVHSLKTGLLSGRQQRMSHLMTGIKRDIANLKHLSESVPVAVTWDASINACLPGIHGADCALNEQLYRAVEKEPRRYNNEGKLNDYTENFGKDIMNELRNANIGAWFFRTAKLQSTDINSSSRRHVKRRVSEQVISGNDFLSLYENGMIHGRDLLPSKSHKNVIAPIVLGLGALGAGALGAASWVFWDDIKRVANDVKDYFKNPAPIKPVVKKAEPMRLAEKPWTKPITPASIPKSVSVPSNDVENDWEIVRLEDYEDIPDSPPYVPMMVSPSIPSPESELFTSPPFIPVTDTIPTREMSLEIPESAPSEAGIDQDRPTSEVSSEDDWYMVIPPAEPPRKYPKIPGWEPRPPWGTVDKTHLPPVEKTIAQLQTPPEIDEVLAHRESVVLDKDVSVAERIEKMEERDSRRNSAHLSHAESVRSDVPGSEASGSHRSEFKPAPRISKWEKERIRPVTEVQKELIEKGLPESITGKRPVSNLESGNKRDGVIVSKDDQERLQQMLKEHDVKSRKGGESEHDNLHSTGPEVQQESLLMMSLTYRPLPALTTLQRKKKTSWYILPLRS